jgi:hypothetical protein
MAEQNPIEEVKIEGHVYHFCRKCRMYGEVGWTHICGMNWYPTVEELDEVSSRMGRHL